MDVRTPGMTGLGSLVFGNHVDFSVRLMEHLVVPTFVLDADCRVIIWNRACERLTGVPAERVLGTRNHWQAFYSEPRPCLADLIVQGRTAEIDTYYADYDSPDDGGTIAYGRRAENWCVMPQAGSRLYLAVDAGPIYDDSGKLIAAVETLRDMTARKIAQEELQKLAVRDGLTGIANRRAFDAALEAEWRRSAREKSDLSLLMIDVDYFKPYNDTNGHQCGDDCLRLVAEELTRSVSRAGDLTARYGGEEFVVLLPNTPSEGALQIAERIRSAVAALALPHPASMIGDHVTVSVGAATARVSRAEPASGLVARADAALYEAKQAGRNRVIQFV